MVKKAQKDEMEQTIEQQEEAARKATEEETNSKSTPEAQHAAALAEAAANLDGWQRERAAFANYRKRTERERAETYQRAKTDVLAHILPALDDFTRAVENIPAELQDNEWVAGVTLVQRKMQSTLKSLGVAEIDALGQPFDPQQHEAVMQGESDEYAPGHVMEVLQKGYQLGDIVIRPAMVRVAT